MQSCDEKIPIMIIIFLKQHFLLSTTEKNRTQWPPLKLITGSLQTSLKHEWITHKSITDGTFCVYCELTWE